MLVLLANDIPANCGQSKHQFESIRDLLGRYFPDSRRISMQVRYANATQISTHDSSGTVTDYSVSFFALSSFRFV